MGYHGDRWVLIAELAWKLVFIDEPLLTATQARTNDFLNIYVM